ncbi:MAG: histidine--tRNA ligase [Spirochaetaceae bacterium]|nr:MAG: histidine--tRNA ligase [Spirochaetaceae bacterium]
MKGFRDFLPSGEIRRKQLIRILEDQFHAFGFVPIDTPMLEYAQVLLGKGGGETDKQVYRFEDHGGRDVALRFDLTVPFARYMAMHRNELYLPFKRFHISKVFRGENTQRGRYREFTQCDFDIVGTETLSSDLEIVLMIVSAFEALRVPGVTVHLSHRGVFNRFLRHHGAQDRGEEVLRVVDKLRKVGREATLEALTELTSREVAEKALAFIGAQGTYGEILTTIEDLSGGPGPESARLRELGAALEQLVPAGTVLLDPSITRGLDYYTGVVFETFIKGAENIGSVCSGGRYDDLVALYSRESMPGVGASIGLDRLLAALEELDVGTGEPAAVDLLITMQDTELTAHYHELARTFRAAGLRVEVFPEQQKLGRQFAFAERKGIPLALVCGAEEKASGTVNLRILADRENRENLKPEEARQLAVQLIRNPEK